MATSSAFGPVHPHDHLGGESFEEVCRFVAEAEDTMATPSFPVKEDSFSEILSWLAEGAETVVPTSSIRQSVGFNAMSDALHPSSNSTSDNMPIVTDDGAAALDTPNVSPDDSPGGAYNPRSVGSCASPESSSGSEADSSSPAPSSPTPSTHTPPVLLLGSVVTTTPGDPNQPQPTKYNKPTPKRPKKELPKFKRVELEVFNDVLATHRTGVFPVRELQERLRGVSGLNRRLWEISGKLTQLRRNIKERRRAELQAQMAANGIVL